MGNCKYKRLDSIKLNNRTVFIDDNVKCVGKKEVYKVIFDLEDKKQYILKAIFGEGAEAINTIDFYMDDEHNYFMEMIDFYKDDLKTFLLLKYYQGGTLYTVTNPTEQQRDRYISNILEIGCYLHKNGYIHGDIKPDNFFIDRDKVRVGDLESIVKLDDIQNETIETLSGTKGFKYSSDHTYTLKDEIFAYIATIYFIEVGELLMDKKEFAELTEEENPFNAINDFAREQIRYISRENIKNFLLDIIDTLEYNQKVDCCTMQEHFELLPKKPTKDNFIDGDHNKVKREVKKWKKPLMIVLGSTVLIYLATLFITQPSTPTCNEAFFVTDQMIKVIQKNGDVDIYNYSKDKNFTLISDERSLDFIDMESLFRNSKGMEVECFEGRVRIQ